MQIPTVFLCSKIGVRILVHTASLRQSDQGLLDMKSGDIVEMQDRDESEESLRKGLPVVSFSIGDSAEFLYGDQRDIVKAEKVLLESGDVLIFGGKSRHIFHGIPSILQDTAPKALLEESRLRTGRLNLTFREY